MCIHKFNHVGDPMARPDLFARFELGGLLPTRIVMASMTRNRAGSGNGIEIHGANGYLIDQFLRDGTNRRTDHYGGGVANRARFLLEVTEAVAGVWGADRVGVRLSPWSDFNSMHDSDPPATFSHAARALARFGLAYLHVVEPVGSVPAGAAPLAPDLKVAFGGALMANGSYTRPLAEAALERGEADLVSFAAWFLANPDPPPLLRRVPKRPARLALRIGARNADVLEQALVECEQRTPLARHLLPAQD
jgi:N-ethylmaleimide reductase